MEDKMHELLLAAPASRVDVLSEALEALGALSISSEDAEAGTPQEQALFGEPGMPPPGSAWNQTRVSALFPDAASAAEAARLLPLQDFFEGCALQPPRALQPQDWVRLTQSQFDPVEITPDFWIVPSWHAVPPAARQVIHLDPGLAFGTGTHPTTRMCLRWIATHPPQGQRVLDYGCGSGILAIAAALHGAAEVHAVDIDRAAVQATRDNAAANSAELTAGSPELASGRYDLVLANILASPLKVLAPLLCGHVARPGALLLAGILERQVEELQVCYQPWLELQVSDTDAGWVLMTARPGH